MRTPNLIHEYVDELMITLPSPRMSYYESSNFEVIRGRVSNHLQEIEEALGFFPIRVTSELLHDLGLYSRGVLFLGIIFDTVVLLLVIISVLLIYSLLLISVETRSFEIGVQRMLGLSNKGLVISVFL